MKKTAAEEISSTIQKLQRIDESTIGSMIDNFFKR
jgi:hypothetical protein